MTATSDPTNVDRAVNGFSKAEAALRKIIDQAENLASAENAVKGATKSLEGAEKSLADGSSAIYELAADMKDAARELKNNSIALRELDPGRVGRQLASLETQLKEDVVVQLTSLETQLEAVLAQAARIQQRLNITLGVVTAAALFSFVILAIFVLR